MDQFPPSALKLSSHQQLFNISIHSGTLLLDNWIPRSIRGQREHSENDLAGEVRLDYEGSTASNITSV